MRIFLQAKRGLILSLVMLMTGCAVAPTWQRVTEPTYVDTHDGYTIDLPADWMRFKNDTYGVLTVTRDGPTLQAIRVAHRSHEKAFGAIEQESSPDMLPEELAEYYVANVKKILDLDVIEVISNEPADVGGLPGFRVLLQYKTPKGLRFKTIVYGTAAADGFYAVSYDAAVLRYFDRNLSDFQHSIQSFRITATS